MQPLQCDAVHYIDYTLHCIVMYCITLHHTLDLDASTICAAMQRPLKYFVHNCVHCAQHSLILQLVVQSTLHTTYKAHTIDVIFCHERKLQRFLIGEYF